ncbi:hypothetical protein V491_03874 [Pseudogymnoascus sp. VKM F-3775]|nr:hypothetical protein V491_03874 [Pseudogymnoascus sp. VKM F-3775]
MSNLYYTKSRSTERLRGYYPGSPDSPSAKNFTPTGCEYDHTRNPALPVMWLAYNATGSMSEQQIWSRLGRKL